MKTLILSLSVMVVAFTASVRKVQADSFTGYYKIAVIENEIEIFDGVEYRDETEGASGRGKVYINQSGKLRFSGWVEDYDYDDNSDVLKTRTKLRGVVNATTGKIRITKVGGISVKTLALEENFTLKLKIIKREGIVVGLKGSGSSQEIEDDGSTEEELYDVTGYKTRDLSK
jgi:hypothetical protein